jgi:DNA-binding transcriptional LysR family regulator
MTMRLDLGQVMCFLAVADELNFHRAAEKVNLTQQAVSKNLKQLEYRLGVKLFDRDRKSVELTSFGELMLPHARAIAAEVGQIEFNIEAALGSTGGQLRIGASPTLISQFVPEILREVYPKRKGVSILIERGDYLQLEAGLLEGRYDVVFSTKPTKTPDPLIEMATIGEDRYGVIGRAAHPILAELVGLAEKETGDALKRYPWLSLHQFPRADSDLREMFAQMKKRPPIPMLQSGSVLFSLNWIADSDFLCAIPLQLAQRDIALGRLTRIPIPSETDPWKLIIAKRRRGTLPAAAHDLIKAATKAGAAKAR